MKRFLSLIMVCFFLFISIAPVFSFAATAGFVVNSIFRYSDVSTGSYSSSWVVAQNSNNAYIFRASIDNLDGEEVLDCRLYFSSTSEPGLPGFAIQVSNNNTHSSTAKYRVQYDTLNIITGQSIAIISEYSFNGNYVFRTASSSVISNNNQEWACYAIPEFEFDTVSTQSFYFANVVDPFVVWALPSLSQRTVRSSLCKPSSDNTHFYLADKDYLYTFIPYSEGLVYDNGVDTSGDLTYQGIVPYIQSGESQNQIKITFYNPSAVVSRYFLFIYSIVDGAFVSYSSKSTSSQLCTFTLNMSNIINYGLWYEGFIPFNNTLSFPILPISWSDTIDYSSDFAYIETLLENVNSNLTILDGDIDLVNTRLNGFITLCNEYFTWYKQTYYRFTYESWTSALTELGRIYTVVNYSYGLLLQHIYPDLQSIKNALVDHTETEPDTSAFQDNISEYEEGESYIVNQAEVALDDFESQLSGAADVLTVNSRGLLFVKNIFETFAFSGLNYYYILFVLVLGSVALLIGRKLR